MFLHYSGNPVDRTIVYLLHNKFFLKKTGVASLDWFAELKVVNISSKVNSYQRSKTRVVTSPTETRDIRSTVLFSGTFLLNKTSLRTSPDVGRTLFTSQERSLLAKQPVVCRSGDL